MEKQRVLDEYGVTIITLNEFRRNKPSYEKLKAYQVELKKTRDNIITQQINAEIDKYTRDYEWSIEEEELDRANEQLHIEVEPRQLYTLVQELYHYPSKYTDIINALLETRI